MFLLYKRDWRTRSNCEWLLPTALQLTFLSFIACFEGRVLCFIETDVCKYKRTFLRSFSQVDRLQKYVGKQLTQRDHSLRKFRRKSVNTVDAYSFPLGILGLDRNSNGIAHLSGIDRIAQTWKLSRTLPVFLRTYFKLNYEMVRQNQIMDEYD